MTRPGSVCVLLFIRVGSRNKSMHHVCRGVPFCAGHAANPNHSSHELAPQLFEWQEVCVRHGLPRFAWSKDT